MSAPSQADELRNTLPVHYLPYHPSGPRRLPFQNLQQLHVADIMTIVCAVNKHQYEQRLPRQVVRDLEAMVTTNPLIRRFFRDAFWWLFLAHFSEIDLELLLNVAKQNVLLSSSDAAQMSLEAIRKRTAALAPKLPPSSIATVGSTKKEVGACGANAASNYVDKAESNRLLTSKQLTSEIGEEKRGGGGGSVGRRASSINAPSPRMPPLGSPASHFGVGDATGSGMGMASPRRGSDSEHDKYRQRMVSLKHDTAAKLQQMMAARKARAPEGDERTEIEDSGVHAVVAADKSGTPKPSSSNEIALVTAQEEQLQRAKKPVASPSSGGFSPTKYTYGGVVMTPIPSHLSLRAGNRTTEQLAVVGSPTMADVKRLAQIIQNEKSDELRRRGGQGGRGPSSSRGDRSRHQQLVGASSSSSPTSLPTSPLAPTPPHLSASSSLTVGGRSQAQPFSPRSQKRYVTRLQLQRMKSATGHSDTDTESMEDYEEEYMYDEKEEERDNLLAIAPTEESSRKFLPPSSAFSKSAIRNITAASASSGDGEEKEEEAGEQEKKRNSGRRPLPQKPRPLCLVDIATTSRCPSESVKEDKNEESDQKRNTTKQLTFVFGNVEGTTRVQKGLREEMVTRDEGNPPEGAMALIHGRQRGIETAPLARGVRGEEEAHDSTEEILAEAMSIRKFKTSSMKITTTDTNEEEDGFLLPSERKEGREDTDDEETIGSTNTRDESVALRAQQQQRRSNRFPFPQVTPPPSQPSSMAKMSGSPLSPRTATSQQALLQLSSKRAVRGINVATMAMIALSSDLSDPATSTCSQTQSPPHPPKTLVVKSARLVVGDHHNDLLLDNQRKAFVQAEHHKLFSRMAMLYGQLLLDLIHGKAVGSSGVITSKPRRRTKGETTTTRSRSRSPPLNVPHSLASKEDLERDRNAASTARATTTRATTATTATTDLVSPSHHTSLPLLGRFESTVHRDVLIGYLPDLLAQGLYMAFALSLPFTVGTLLDADFQLSILRHVTFWIHGVESTQRFIIGTAMQISQPLPQHQQQQQQQQVNNKGKPSQAAEGRDISGRLPSNTYLKKEPSGSNESSSNANDKQPGETTASSSPSGPAPVILTTVTLPNVTSISALQRHQTNPTLAAQDARSFKTSASVSSWPVNAVMTIISRRRKEFWQLVKDGKAHPVTDFSPATLESLRLILKTAKMTGNGAILREEDVQRQKEKMLKKHLRRQKVKEELQRLLSSGGGGGGDTNTTDRSPYQQHRSPHQSSNPSSGVVPSPPPPPLPSSRYQHAASPPPEQPLTQQPQPSPQAKRASFADSINTSSPPSRATSAGRRRGGGGGQISAHLLNQLLTHQAGSGVGDGVGVGGRGGPRFSSKEEIVERQVMAFNREMQRVHTTHTFASINAMAIDAGGGGLLTSDDGSALSLRGRDKAGASSKGMDAFLDSIAKQQRRESQAARRQQNDGTSASPPPLLGTATTSSASSQRFGMTQPSTSRHAKVAASVQLLAQSGIDVSGRITTVRNVHTIKKELDERHQPVAPWFMKPDARIRKRTGALYYLSGGGSGGGGGLGAGAAGTDDSENKDREEGGNTGDASSAAAAKEGSNNNNTNTRVRDLPQVLGANPAAAAPATARFTLTNWSPLIQRYMLLLGGKNHSFPESMAWTLTDA